MRYLFRCVFWAAVIACLAGVFTSCAALKVGLGAATGAGLGFAVGGPVGAIAGAPIGAVAGDTLAENDRLRDENETLRATNTREFETLKRRADDAQRRLDAIRGAPPYDPRVFDPPLLDSRPWWTRPLGELFHDAELRDRQL